MLYLTHTSAKRTVQKLLWLLYSVQFEVFLDVFGPHDPKLLDNNISETERDFGQRFSI